MRLWSEWPGRGASIDWDRFSLHEPQETVRSRKKNLRPHQREALDAVVGGKLVMACGTGKTFTSLRIAERLAQHGSGRVLFLVASIALLSQTLRAWNAEAAAPLRSFALGSNGKVNKGRSLRPSVDEDISAADLAIPTTTDPERLTVALREPAPVISIEAHQRHRPAMTVVFCTYQSIDVIHRAQALGALDFDLAICDEAHRTTGATVAGQDESAFVRVRGAGYIRGSKRLYLTATPRVHAPDVKDNAQRKDLVLASMDDESIHGPELYRLGFGRAVKHGLLTDYKVLVLTVSEAQVSRTLQSSFAANGDLALDDAARIVGCWNALTKQTQDPAGYEASPDRRHPRRGSGLRTGGQKRLGLDRGTLPGTGRQSLRPSSTTPTTGPAKPATPAAPWSTSPLFPLTPSRLWPPHPGWTRTARRRDEDHISPIRHHVLLRSR